MSEKKRLNKSSFKTTYLILLAIILLVGYYAYLSNKTRNQINETKQTIQQVILKEDLSKNYPATPKEVIKSYNRILKCFYNENCSIDEIHQLGLKIRELYDEELLAYNPEEIYLSRLEDEIMVYKGKERRIGYISLAASINVEEYNVDNYQCAKISCIYEIMEGSKRIPTKIVYVLRKDENRHWKIYGWKTIIPDKEKI